LADDDLAAGDAATLAAGHTTSKGHLGSNNRLVRAILVYGRSRALPTLPAAKPPLLDHPRFFLDVLYVHRKVNATGESLECLRGEGGRGGSVCVCFHCQAVIRQTGGLVVSVRCLARVCLVRFA
jgi:hypothetical protein